MLPTASCTISRSYIDKGAAVTFARRIRSFLCDRTGSITVEFVAMTPVILVALVFSFEFGRALWAYDIMSRDVRSATRFLSRDGTVEPNRSTRARNVAETGSPAGGPKHFPWNTADCDLGACIGFNTSAKSGTYSSPVTVYQMVASVPITLGFLEAMNNFLSAANIPTSYTLVVTDEVRWIGD